MKFKLNPLQKCALFLSVYALFPFVYNFSNQTVLHLVATLGLGVLTYFVLGALSSKKKNYLNVVITSLILFLILDPGVSNTDLMLTGGVTLTAIIYKYFLEIKGKPVINPAVFSILFMATIALLLPNVDTLFVSWWGASYLEPLAFGLMILWIATGLRTWRKFPLVLSFFAVFVPYMLFAQGVDFLQYVLLTGTIYFYSCIMLVDPKTSPVAKNHQVMCGLLTGFAYVLLFHFGVNYVEILSIALMNVCTYILMTQKQQSTTKKI